MNKISTIRRLNLGSILALATAFFVTVAIIGLTDESAALPGIANTFACAKNYFIKLLSDKLIERSVVVKQYKATMKVIEQRFEQAERSGELDGKDEVERKNVLMKISIEEIDKLKSVLDIALNQEPGLDEETANELIDHNCFDPDAMLENWDPDNEDFSEHDDMKEIELRNDLAELEALAAKEDAMGWSMSEQSKKQLRSRTMKVMEDLLSNEVRQLAVAVVSGYLTGGASFISPALVGAMKAKVVNYLMNGLVDIVSSIMGIKITIDQDPSYFAADTEATDMDVDVAVPGDQAMAAPGDQTMAAPGDQTMAAPDALAIGAPGAQAMATAGAKAMAALGAQAMAA